MFRLGLDINRKVKEKPQPESELQRWLSQWSACYTAWGPESDRQHPPEKPGIVSWAWNHSTEKSKTGGSLRLNSLKKARLQVPDSNSISSKIDASYILTSDIDTCTPAPIHRHTFRYMYIKMKYEIKWNGNASKNLQHRINFVTTLLYSAVST